jgi:thiol-disulfide isomerase/thioredoxin
MIRSVFLTLLLLPVSGVAGEKPELLAVGTEPPSFTLRTLNPKESGLRRAVLRRTIGKRAKTKNIKLLAISFYATWCESCQDEVPLLDKWATQLKPQGFSAFVVGTDKGTDGKNKLKKRIGEMGLTLPVFHDSMNVLMRRYKAAALPTLYLIDGSGKIVFAKAGFSLKKGDDKKLLETIRKYL